MSHLKALEDEAIYIIREAYAGCKKPVILFSGGKDSTVVLHLAKKSFYPATIPFPLLHIDTGHNFKETIAFRDNLVKKNKLELIIARVGDFIEKGILIEESGSDASRNALQSKCLLETLQEHQIDAAIGGARRDEEKARAKERIFSHRDKHGQWNPKNQRPEISNLYNAHKKEGENFRIFPLSNWTELDIWNYLQAEKIEIPSLYFAHHRKVFTRQGVILSKSEFINNCPDEIIETKSVRFRTLGDITCTGAILSNASSIEEIISELSEASEPERGNRRDDKKSDTSMDDRKKEG